MSDMNAYSFDVFDTCITRMHAYPQDLFYEMGLRLAPASFRERQKREFAAIFQSLRIGAERKAHRCARPRSTVTIEEIYRFLPIPRVLAVEAQDLIRAEIDLERESIYPIPAMISYIESLRRAGNRIIFISDMYLSSSILRPILMGRGVMKEGDALYVSCDVGLTKHHGQLFHHVLEAEGLEASQLIHTGDNLHADIRMATNAKIRVSHLRDGMLTSREASVAGHRLPRHRANSFLAAFARRLRLSEPTQAAREDDPLGHIIHGVIVPLLLTYVAWVLDHAERNGTKRLYFVARDGEILYRIAQVLRGERNVELRYLYGSRRAWLPPSIRIGNADWHRLIVTAGQANSRCDMVERMGLDDASQEAIRKLLVCNVAQWSAPLSHDQAHAFLAGLIGNDLALKLITSSATQKREIALFYLAQEGLMDDVSWALVDAGWSLNSQAALKRILDAGGTAHRDPNGYYLALGQDHLSEAQAGIAYPFIPGAGSILTRRRVAIEHCFLPATHATTNGYRMDGNRALPTFSPELRGQAELRYAKRLHEAATSAAKVLTADGNLAAALTAHVREILSTAERLLRHPSVADARAMSTFGTIADLRHEKSLVKPLCHALQVKDLWTILANGLSKKGLERRSFVWLEGSIMLSPIHVRIPLKFLLWIGSLRDGITGRD